jgi:hypothetical protein
LFEQQEKRDGLRFRFAMVSNASWAAKSFLNEERPPEKIPGGVVYIRDDGAYFSFSGT